MNTNRECGCKSFRTCFVCEKAFGLSSTSDEATTRFESFERVFTFDPESGFIVNDNEEIFMPGIKLIKDFITQDEEAELIADLDALPWDASQSGRRKQNFGPKANFKKRKTKVGAFTGFPKCTEFAQRRFESVAALDGYRTVEQCSIEYRPETGACIEPHIDDCWIWGERIVQLNLLSDSYLTCLPYIPKTPEKPKYNLQDLDNFPRILDDAGNVVFNPFRKDDDSDSKPYRRKDGVGLLNAAVRIPLPRRSLLIFFGEPRYDWEHCILRQDIKERRVVIAYRELTPPYLPNGRFYDIIGKDILNQASIFW